MVNRMAGALALLAFAVCLVVGLEAQNTFETTVERALAAMAVTLIIGLIVGAMGRRMLEENVKSEAEKIKKSWTTPPEGGR